MKKVLVFDNYDSFTYNLVHMIEKIIKQRVDVHRNDKISLDEISGYDKIVLSPGPGLPGEAGILKQVINTFAPAKSILGVCLGHQAIGEVFGAVLINLPMVFHGVATPIHITKQQDVIFYNIPKQFTAGRYHSWIIDRETLPDCFEVTAEDEQGQIMAITHKEFDVRGVQFHPERILTTHGEKLLSNWLSY